MIAATAAARASLYRLLALAFDYPQREVFEALRSGEFQDALASIGNTLQLPLGRLPLIACDHQNFESEYLATFELGRSGEIPCSLQEGAYSGCTQDGSAPDLGSGRAALLEDLLRFYHHFGLRLTEDPAHRLPPDHLVCQLEMLAHLSLRESMEKASDSAAAGYRDAQRDFMRRHLCVWLPQLVRALKECPALSEVRLLYCAVAEMSMASATAHLNCCSRGQPPTGLTVGAKTRPRPQPASGGGCARRRPGRRARPGCLPSRGRHR